MKQVPSDTTTRATPEREPSDRGRDDAPERDDREWRIGATQMAAPSTRRWRRAGRFEEA